MFRRAIMGLLTATFIFGAASLLAPATPAKPKPPSCPNCQPTIVIGGRVCTLTSCGFDCVYTCPF